MSEYREFTGKTVEEALRQAREAFGAELNDLDFEILTPGSRGVLGMGAEPARIVAAPRAALGGAAPKREAAAAVPLPPAPPRPPREDRPYDDRGPRRDDRAPRRDDRPRDDRPRDDRPRDDARADRPRGSPTAPRRPRPRGRPAARRPARRETIATTRRPVADRRTCPPRRRPRSPPRLAARWPRSAQTWRPPRRRPRRSRPARRSSRPSWAISASTSASRSTTGETSRLNVVADGDEKEALGALIGRKGERLSALQHLVNLMLSKEIGTWTRVLVDVEDYRGRRERQLRELADRAAARVVETGKMLQLEPMSALERRWIHLALRDHPAVATQSIGEEPNRRVVLIPRATG